MKIYTAKNYDEIKKITAKLIANRPNLIDDRAIVFCEDKFTLEIEKAIAKSTGGGFNHRVSSFNLYMKEHQGDKNVLSRRSSAILILKIMYDLKDELHVFKSSSKGGFAETVYELIAQLKSAKIQPKDLYNAMAGDGINGFLREKLGDIYTVYNAYEKYLEENGLFDSYNYLSLMPSVIGSDKDIKDTTVFLVGYSSITKQTGNIFKAFNENAKEVIAVTLYGENQDVFLNETYEFLKSIGGKEEKTELSSNETANFLQNCLYKAEEVKQPLLTCDVEIFSADDVHREINKALTEIVKLVKKEGYRYKDLSLTVGDLSSYKLPLCRALKSYGIPYYIEEEQNLAVHPIARLIKRIIDVSLSGYDSGKIYSLVTDRLFCSDVNACDKFITYCNVNSVVRKGYKTPFIDEDTEIIRQKLISTVEPFIKKHTVKEFTESIKKVFALLNVKENLEKENDYLKNYGEDVKVAFNEQALQKFDETLIELTTVLGDTETEPREFYNVLNSAMTACKISLIPQYNDCLYVTDISNAKYVYTKRVFALGVNSSVPYVKADTALLADGDLSLLDDVNLLIEPKIRIVNRRSREATVVALTSFKEKLYLSYSLTDCGGKDCLPSEIITQIDSVCKNTDGKSLIISAKDLDKKYSTKYEITDETREFIAEKYLAEKPALKQFIIDAKKYKYHLIADFTGGTTYYKAIDGLPIKDKIDELLEGLSYKVNYTEKINADKKLYLSNGEISVTTLEDYFACPYKCFMEHGLKIKKEDEKEVKSNEYGDLIHEVLQRYVGKIRQGEIPSNTEESKKLTGELFDNEIKKEKYARFSKNAQSQFFSSLLKTELENCCERLLGALQNSDFTPIGEEVKFGDKADGNTKFDAIKLNVNGETYEIHGTVDRADVSGDYIRIIDYKSGSIQDSGKAFYDEKLLYAGKKLQLYLYMNAFIADGKYKPAGLYYCPVNDEYTAEDEIGGGAKLYGKTLKDDEIISKSDKTLNVGEKSNYINVCKKSSNKGVSYGKDVLGEKDMQNFLEYSKRVSEKAIERILEGYVSPTPYDETCKYCEYKGACGYAGDGERTRKPSGSVVVTEKEKENA